MSTSCPKESPQYRIARDDAKEIELRRAMEAVAAARRALPPGGLVPEDYVFDGLEVSRSSRCRALPSKQTCARQTSLGPAAALAKTRASRPPARQAPIR